MKAGTRIEYCLIADSRFETEILSRINDLFIRLCNDIEGSMKIENLHAVTPRLLNWDDGSQQYRINCILVLQKSMKLDDVYRITNKVQARQLKVVRPKRITIYA